MFRTEVICEPLFWWVSAGILFVMELIINARYYLLWIGMSALVVGLLQWIFQTQDALLLINFYSLFALSVLLIWHIYMPKRLQNTDF